MRQNYHGQKMKREEAKRKKKEAKRLKSLDRKASQLSSAPTETANPADIAPPIL